MEFILERGANVVVTKSRDDRGNQIAKAVINDKWEHTFDKSSRVSKHLQLMSPEDLGQRLSGGTYFIVDGVLTDFRDGSYTGHIHTDKDVGHLMDYIGITRLDGDQRSSPISRIYNSRKSDHRSDGDTSRIIMASEARRFDLSIPALSSDGMMDAGLAYTWSPFQRHLNTMFILTRIACGNDLVSNSHLINARIPMVNRWEQHMAIAGDQLEHKVRRIVPERINELQHYNAAVSTLNNICKHIDERRKHETDGHTRRWLDSLADVTDPSSNLSRYYKQDAIDDARLSSQLPSHLSGVDVFNIVTELRTHTFATEKSSNGALDRIGNDMLFNHAGVLSSFGSTGQVAKSSAFASADDAFYGIGLETA